MARIGHALAVLLAASFIAGAQIDLNPVAPRDPGAINVDVKLVNLLCTVRDKEGHYVKNLTKEDFEVFQDGKRQKVTHFARDVDSPLTAAVLLDVSGSVAPFLDTEKDAAQHFFDSVLRDSDSAMLVGFAQFVLVWQDLTSKRDYLKSALDHAGPMDSSMGRNAHGGTLLYDAVDLVAAQKLKRLAGRKAIILITDGMDNGSRVKADEAIKAAHEADAAIYGIHYVDDPRYKGIGYDALERLANPTGGRAFHVDEKLTLKLIFDAIEEEMRNQYAVGFAPPAGGKPGAYHKLEVKLTKPDIKIQTRTGYYGK
jgi:VWFA-related protein